MVYDEEKKAYLKQYKLDNPKCHLKTTWKRRGLKDDFEMVWDRYVNSTHCEKHKNIKRSYLYKFITPKYLEG